jgi:hypothetical protein
MSMAIGGEWGKAKRRKLGMLVVRPRNKKVMICPLVKTREPRS